MLLDLTSVDGPQLNDIIKQPLILISVAWLHFGASGSILLALCSQVNPKTNGLGIMGA